MSKIHFKRVHMHPRAKNPCPKFRSKSLAMGSNSDGAPKIYIFKKKNTQVIRMKFAKVSPEIIRLKSLQFSLYFKRCITCGINGYFNIIPIFHI
jgi:hypothetical protein